MEHLLCAIQCGQLFVALRGFVGEDASGKYSRNGILTTVSGASAQIQKGGMR